MLPSPPLGQGNSGNVFIVNCCSRDLERNVAWCRLHFIVLNSHRHCSWKSYAEKVLVTILLLSVDRTYPGELCLAPAVIHSCSLTDTSWGNVPHSEVGTLTAVGYGHPISCAVVQLPVQITPSPPHWNQLPVRATGEVLGLQFPPLLWNIETCTMAWSKGNASRPLSL